MFGHVVFSLFASFIAMAVVLILGLLGDRVSKQLTAVLAVALGLACAWSWEHCFDLAIDNVAETFHIIKGFSDATFLKIVVALACPFLLLPPYMHHVKPVIIVYEDGGGEEKREAE